MPAAVTSLLQTSPALASAIAASKAAPSPDNEQVLGARVEKSPWWIRATGLLPLAGGVMQAFAGYLITNGTISLAAAPIIGSWPGWVVGFLIAATSTPSIMQGVRTLMGNPPQ